MKEKEYPVVQYVLIVHSYGICANIRITCNSLNTASCYTTIVGEQPCDLYLMESIPQPTSAFPYIWPMPQSFTNGSTNITVNALKFAFQTNVSSTDVNNAIQRFQKQIFPHPSASTSPSVNTITGVTINIGNTSVPLQLYADESYTIDIPSYAGYITIEAATGLDRTVMMVL